MPKTVVRCLPLTPALLLLLATSSAGAKDTKAYTDPMNADTDFSVQGEYTGTVKGKEGDKKLGVQVIALGDGRFRAVGYAAGLPGDGWEGGEKEAVEASLADGVVTFVGKHATGVIKDGEMHVTDKEGTPIGDLKRVLRTSPTLGEKPPAGAIVLFDGRSADHWVNTRGGPAKMTEDGLLMHGANSKQKFASHKLHIEFQLPYQPHARGQGRGNSGLYLQGRYEVQMLDSFGLDGLDNECGGIYSVSRPRINMCYPPLSWQTYDVDFTAAQYDADGKKTRHARITVRHNGVLIHEDAELPKRTQGGPTAEGPEPGVVHLQDHGNPVRYRNIWVVENE